MLCEVGGADGHPFFKGNGKNSAIRNNVRVFFYVLRRNYKPPQNMDFEKEWNTLVLPEASEILENKRLYVLNLSDEEYSFLRYALLRFLHFSNIFPAKIKNFDAVQIDLLSDLFIDSFLEEKPNFNQFRISFAELSLIRDFLAFLCGFLKNEILFALTPKIYNIFYS